MIDHATLITYLAVLIGFVFIPGPAVLMTLTRAMGSGTRVGIATGLGIAAGDLAHTAMAVFGLSAVLLASALLFDVVKYIGAAYLVYLGIRAILERTDSLLPARAAPITPGAPFARRCCGDPQSQVRAVLRGLPAAFVARSTAPCRCSWPRSASSSSRRHLQHHGLRARRRPHRPLPSPQPGHCPLAGQGGRVRSTARSASAWRCRTANGGKSPPKAPRLGLS